MKAIKVPRDVDRPIVEAFESVRECVQDVDSRVGVYSLSVVLSSDMAALAPREVTIHKLQYDSTIDGAWFTASQSAAATDMLLRIIRRDAQGRNSQSTALINSSSGAATAWTAFMPKPFDLSGGKVLSGELLTLAWSKAGGFAGPFYGCLTMHLRRAVSA